MRWDDVAAAKVDGNVAKRGVDGDVGPGAWNVLDGEGIPVVVDFALVPSAGEDARDGCGTLFQGRCDQEGRAEEELAVLLISQSEQTLEGWKMK